MRVVVLAALAALAGCASNEQIAARQCASPDMPTTSAAYRECWNSTMRTLIYQDAAASNAYAAMTASGAALYSAGRAQPYYAAPRPTTCIRQGAFLNCF